MENVEVKEVKEEKKVEKKVVKKQKKDDGKVKFMEDRNAKRKKAGLPEAYSKEEIAAYK